jgi:hypothetical protein
MLQPDFSNSPGFEWLLDKMTSIQSKQYFVRKFSGSVFGSLIPIKINHLKLTSSVRIQIPNTVTI